MCSGSDVIQAAVLVGDATLQRVHPVLLLASCQGSGDIIALESDQRHNELEPVLKGTPFRPILPHLQEIDCTSSPHFFPSADNVQKSCIAPCAEKHGEATLTR
jgi:hypothetical protein